MQESLLAPLVEVSELVVATRAFGGDRARAPGELGRAARELRPSLVVEEADDPIAAVEHALALARARDMSVVVTGGHALCGEVSAVVRGRDPRSLARFAWHR